MKNTSSLLIILLIVIIVITQVNSLCSTTERETLNSFANTFDWASWDYNTNWNDSLSDCCDRYGIQCITNQTGSYVSEIYFNYNRISGTGSIDFTNLTQLNELQLDFTDATITSFLYPPSLSSLLMQAQYQNNPSVFPLVVSSTLQSLYLVEFKGEIVLPTTANQLSILSCQYCVLSTPIDFSSTSLNLSSLNQINFRIADPADIVTDFDVFINAVCGLNNLTIFNFQVQTLTETQFPTCLTTKHWDSLMYNYNVVDSFPTFTSAIVLDLSHQSWTTIPQTLPPNLEFLRCEYCNFKGSLPAGWAQSNLTELYLAYNFFDGLVPKALIPLPFYTVDLGYNSFDNDVNDFLDIAKHSQWKFTQNNITGSFSSEWNYKDIPYFMDLSFTNVTGLVPRWIPCYRLFFDLTDARVSAILGFNAKNHKAEVPFCDSIPFLDENWAVPIPENGTNLEIFMGDIYAYLSPECLDDVELTDQYGNAICIGSQEYSLLVDGNAIDGVICNITDMTGNILCTLPLLEVDNSSVIEFQLGGIPFEVSFIGPPLLNTVTEYLNPFSEVELTITGKNFGNKRVPAKVKINSYNHSIDCEVVSKNQTVIIANVPDGYEPANSLNVLYSYEVQVGHQSTRFDNQLTFSTYSSQQEKASCYSQSNQICGSHGTCSKHGCICDEGYYGGTCQLKLTDFEFTQPSQIDSEEPTVHIKPTVNTEYNITIQEIREVDAYLNIKKKFTPTWTQIQTIDNVNTTTYIYKSNQFQSNAYATVNLIVFKNTTSVEFGGDIIETVNGTIKYTIEIGNYTFASYLNTMQLVFKLNSYDNTQNSCDQGRGADITLDSNSNDIKWMEMSRRNTKLVARMTNRAYIDSRLVYVQYRVEPTSTTETNVVANIPWFRGKAVLDPNYSVLLKVNSDSSDDSNPSSCPNANQAEIIKSKNNAWMGAVIGSTVGAAAIASAFAGYKFHKTQLKKAEFDKKVKRKLTELGMAPPPLPNN